MVSPDVSAGKDSLQQVGSMVRPVLLERTHAHILDERDIRQMVDRAENWRMAMGNSVPGEKRSRRWANHGRHGGGWFVPMSSWFQMASEVGCTHVP